MGSTGDPGGASSLALYGPVTSGQASPSLRRQQAAPWGGRGRPLHQHYAQGTPPGQDQLAPRVSCIQPLSTSRTRDRQRWPVSQYQLRTSAS
jgi:hypothetical protein